VGDAWAGLAKMPVVAGALQTVQPSIDYAWHKYLEAHDALVTAPSYNKCVLQAFPLALQQPADVALQPVVRNLAMCFF
jgi:hypothetical protein